MLDTTHLIRTLDELTEHYSAPRQSSLDKTHDSLTESMRRWLSHSPFFVLSSFNANGIDSSPRGDAPGTAFHILDAKHLAIPDRRGNNRIDTLKNIINDSRVGLVFLIPGVEETLRIRGNACISVDPALLRQSQHEGIEPATVIVVEINSAYVQNARAIRKADLWNNDALDTSLIPKPRDLYK
ncbi:MAG: MSMEG_1061 family FMN-dependent PPOX-type flavoprotein [Granulosicoccus sp.]